MNKNLMKNLLPHLGAILVMLMITVIYFYPEISGKVLNQSDNMQAYGMQAEAKELKEKTGEYPLWTNSAFGGMPTFQILGILGKTFLTKIHTPLLLWQGVTSPIGTTFLLMLGFYVLMISLRVDWRLSLAGAIMYGLALNHVILADAGHSNKLVAQGYLAFALAGIFLTFKGRYLLGGGLTALFLGLELYANHLQITYYFLLFMVILGIAKFVEAIRENNLPHFTKASTVLVLAGLLAVSTSIHRIWTTYEYGQETTRGKSELTAKEGKTGLDKEYAFTWSYGKLETMNLLIPNFYGGGSSLLYNKAGSETERTLRNLGPKLSQNQQEFEQVARSTSSYWGDQPFTAGPIYLGAIVILLFFMGLFLVKGPMLWWIVGSSILALMIGWGRNFSIFNDLMFDYFPLFNNFRAVSMSIGLTQLLCGMMGILALQEFFGQEKTKAEKRKALYWGGGITLGLCVLGLLMSFGLDFTRPQELAILGKYPELLEALRADRSGMLMMDALRSLAFVGVAAAILWVYLEGKTKWIYAFGLVAFLAFVDMISVDLRFVSSENFVSKTENDAYKKITEADKQIQLREADNPHYRVLDFSRGNPYKSALTSYHHHSIGGYHAAKLMIFQELVDAHLSNPMESMHILEMLNTRYIINPDRQTGQPQPIPMQNPLGHAWFVNDYEFVENADAEMAALVQLKPAQKAVIQKRFAPYLEGLNLANDSTAAQGNSIKLTSYHPDKMVYESKTDKEQLAVFSEIYYKPEKGWKVFIDDQPVDGFVKANYVLRALRVPAGQHKIEMRFEPTSFYTGRKIAMMGSILVLLLFFGGFFLNLKGNEWQLAEAVTIAEPEVVAPKKSVKKTTSKRKRK